MLKVNKTDEPECLLSFKRKHKPKKWMDYSTEEGEKIKQLLKDHMLHKEQGGFCPYCERLIKNDANGHFEHIKPQSLFPKEFEDYENLIISCNDPHTCGSSKGSQYNETFINPVKENPQKYLRYNLASGEIEGIDKKQAVFTIDALNLNCKKLREQRKTLINTILAMYDNYPKEEFEICFNAACLQSRHNFKTLLKYLNEELH